jgi:adenylate kinase
VPVIVLLGAPGAGKGTQADLLLQWLSLPHVATGDLFRAAIAAQTPLGREAKSFMDRGELVPDAVTVGMVAERLNQPDCAAGVIFDGFPRTVAQAEALATLLTGLGRRLDLVAYVYVPRESLLTRLAGRWTCKNCGAVYHRVFSPEVSRGLCDNCGGPLYQRADDTPETQARRVEVYMAQTAPLIDYYEQKGLLVQIDGEQDIAAVQRDLRRAIESALQHDAPKSHEAR